MPFKSEAQRKWMHANKPEMAKRWEEHTPKGKKLPKKVGKESIDNRIDAVLEGRTSVRLLSGNYLFASQLDRALESIQ